MPWRKPASCLFAIGWLLAFWLEYGFYFVRNTFGYLLWVVSKHKNGVDHIKPNDEEMRYFNGVNGTLYPYSHDDWENEDEQQPPPPSGG